MAPLPQSPVDQIAITGVAQIGNTVSVIVRETGSASGRHVRAGDILAGGQVRVKSIDTSTAEPTVVLTYNGQDYTRTVGSGALIGSL
jgi:Tfp pilus assembly protein PilP